jgi:hypothetical protein
MANKSNESKDIDPKLFYYGAAYGITGLTTFATLNTLPTGSIFMSMPIYLATGAMGGIGSYHLVRSAHKYPVFTQYYTKAGVACAIGSVIGGLTFFMVAPNIIQNQMGIYAIASVGAAIGSTIGMSTIF